MLKLIFAISVFLFLGSPFANAEQVYYCEDEVTAGIHVDKKTYSWEIFDQIARMRYTIKFNFNYTKLYGLDSAESSEGWNCHIPYRIIRAHDNKRICYDEYNSGRVFTFDKKSLRFLYLHGTIYSYLENAVGNVDGFSAGTCQKF